MVERNTELLRRVAEAIRENPKHHDQATWFYHPDYEDRDDDDPAIGPAEVMRKNYVEVQEGKPVHIDCFTEACAAGWIVLLSKVPPDDLPNPYRWKECAMALAGLTEDEADLLFTRTPNNLVVETLLRMADGEDLTDIRRSMSALDPLAP